MAGRRYTPEERTEALTLYTEEGPRAASRHTGIPRSTIAGWAKQEGLRTSHAQNAEAAAAAHLADVAKRKTRLASDLLDDAELLRRQLWEPSIERKAVTVSDGKDAGSHVEVVDIELDQPTYRGQQTILTALAIAVDKVQVLTGEATSIVGTKDLASIDAEVQRLASTLNLGAERESVR